MKRTLIKFVAYGAKLAVSVGGVWFVVDRYDLWSRAPHLFDVHPGWLTLGIALCFVQTAVAALRWQTILRALRLIASTWLVLRVFYVTAFLNSFLPAGLAGNMIRIWLLRNSSRGLLTVVNSVMIDRMVAVLTLFVAATAAQPAIWMKWANTSMTVAVVASTLSLITGVYAVIFIGPRIRLPRLGWATSTLHALSRDLRSVFLDLSALSGTVAAALVSNLLLIAAAFALGRGLDLGLGFADWLVAMPVVLLVTALPISIGGWGTREIAMVYMLGLFGVPSAQAAAVSIEFGLCSTLASLLGAPIWITLRQPMVGKK